LKAGNTIYYDIKADDKIQVSYMLNGISVSIHPYIGGERMLLYVM